MANSKRLAVCHPGKKNKARGLCVNCYAKEQYWSRPDAYRKRNQEYYNEKSRQHRFKLSTEEYTVIQKVKSCRICGASPKEKLHIDHNHESGFIRGVLCANCNRGIGLFRDNPSLLSAASEYLAEQG